MQKSPLEKRPNEYSTSNQRLNIYSKFDGTLEEFASHLKKEYPTLAVTVGTLKNESSKDNWKKRIAKHYQLLEEAYDEEVQKLFKELNNTSIHEMKQYMTELQDFKKTVIEQWKKGEITIRDINTTLKTYIYCYRQATEIYYINSRHSLIPNEQEHNKEINDKKLREFGKLINGE